MADVHNKQTRSYNMSQIKGKNTKPEILVRKFLFANGFRYRLHDNKLPGKPDIVFPKHKIAILIHGCYFHRHKDCNFASTSKTRKDFWSNKMESNVIRDSRNEELLRAMNWKIIKLWECEIEPRRKKSQIRESTLENLRCKIMKLIRKDDTCN